MSCFVVKSSATAFKFEIRSTKSETNPNDQNPNALKQEAFVKSNLTLGCFKF
jgi:hypothetical protein